MRGKRFYARRFLNKRGFQSTAMIYAYVNQSDGNPEKWLEHELVISDCGRQISLDFDVSTPAEASNSLFKLDTLIDVLWGFRQAVREEAKLRENAE